MAGKTIAELAKRYGSVIFFPSFTAATIYADWSHTREWKRQQKQLSELERLKQQS